MSLGALYLIKERTLRWLTLACGVFFVAVAALMRFIHTLAPGESWLVLLIPLGIGISMLAAGLVLKLRGLRLFFIALFVVLGPGLWFLSWLACTTDLLSKAACA